MRPWSLPGTLVEVRGHLAPEHTQADAASNFLDKIASNSGSILDAVKILEAKAMSPGADLPAVLAQLSQLVTTIEGQGKHDVDISGVRACVAALLDSISTAGADVAQLKAQLREQVVRVSALEQRLASLEAEVKADRSKVLLGQLAYTLDEAAVTFVFGAPKGFFNTIKQLDNASKSGALQPAEDRRWRTFQGWMEQQGWTVGRAIQLTQPLRKLRLEPAHGTAEEKAAVSADQLRQWAEAHLGPSSMSPVNDLLQLVAMFTKPGQPLVCVGNIASLLERASAQVGAQAAV